MRFAPSILGRRARNPRSAAMCVAGIEDGAHQAGPDAGAPEHDSFGKQLVQAPGCPLEWTGEGQAVEFNRCLSERRV